MRGITTFVAPLSSGPAYVTPVSTPRLPIHRPSGCAYLSFLSERIVIHFTGPDTSSPFAFLGLLSAVRMGPWPANSLLSERPSMCTAHTPWFGEPLRTAWLTDAAPPMSST